MPKPKIIFIILFIGMFIPPFSVISANLLIMYGFWYFTVLGIRTKIRNYKHEKILRGARDERRARYQDTPVDGGVIYPENFHREEDRLLRYRKP